MNLVEFENRVLGNIFYNPSTQEESVRQDGVASRKAFYATLLTHSQAYLPRPGIVHKSRIICGLDQIARSLNSPWLPPSVTSPVAPSLYVPPQNRPF